MAKPHGDQALFILEELRRDIIEGMLAAGAKLGQEDLARRFGVSRIPVRQALSRLETEGLVTIEPNKGARIAPLAVEDLQEIYEMRIAAEVLALRKALPNLTNATLDRAEVVQRKLEDCPIEIFSTLNAEFHNLLYEPCGMPRLLNHIAVLSDASDRYLRVVAGSLKYADRSHGEHHELLAACRDRDEERAVNCLTSHIREAGALLCAHMT